MNWQFTKGYSCITEDNEVKSFLLEKDYHNSTVIANNKPEKTIQIYDNLNVCTR